LNGVAVARMSVFSFKRFMFKSGKDNASKGALAILEMLRKAIIIVWDSSDDSDYNAR
jgi:hypothetical protein